ncbi:transposase [Pseudoxanthomonas sp. F11]|uniref:transposase n=1 Tax=Pseudoxanthomonas sp. F11 TaxID=3126308 RepID=UPI00300D9D93
MIEGQGRTGETDERDAGAPDMDAGLRLGDEDWRAVLAALPPLVSARARNSAGTRAFLDAVLWIAATGQPWVQLPPGAGPWHSVYVRFTRWAHEGLWDKVIAALDGRPEKAVPLRRLVGAYRRTRAFPAGHPH